MRHSFHSIVALLLLSASSAAQSPSFSSSHNWSPTQRGNQIEFENKLAAVPTRASLRAFHDQFGSEPHIAGTPGDLRNIQRLAATFRMMGLSVQVHEFWAYLAMPIDAAVEIVAPDAVTLSVKENALAEDDYSKDAALSIGFNAYSGNGDVTAEIVYANYGAKQDFEKLKELGVDCTGKIVMARYGGNFRGYKAKFAEQAGAAGLLIYTDPDDSGYRKGLPYPEGGWANDSYIQRGSIVTLDYPGDPLTPGVYASEDAERLDPETVALPRIPVQPIGFGAAREIMSRLQGRPLPQDLIQTWQGGLPFAYRLEGGPELRVRLMVKQERSITKTANVIGTMLGATHPHQKIIIGAHHDAWCHGAGDPLSGTILVYEAAKSFFQLSQAGFKPARTIVFAAWGAEEYGIVGSTEYCEDYADHLMETAVAYINLDAATMGPNFGASAAPSLRKVIEEVTRDVPQARDAQNKTVHQAWLGEKSHPDFGNLGGGSDHIGFYCHLGVPSCGIGAGGAPGTAYHSNYDNLHWYRQVVGDDYEPAIMLARIVNRLAARLANAPLLPLDPVRYAIDTREHLKGWRRRTEELKLPLPPDCTVALEQDIERFEQAAQALMDRLHHRINDGALDQAALDAVNSKLLMMERDWLAIPRPEADAAGPQSEPSKRQSDHAGRMLTANPRPFFRNLYAASDPDSGYAASMLPALAEALEQPSPTAVQQAIDAYRLVFERLEHRMQAIDAVLAAAVETGLEQRP